MNNLLIIILLYSLSIAFSEIAYRLDFPNYISRSIGHIAGSLVSLLLPVLLSNGHEVICCVRDSNRFNSEKYDTPLLKVIEVDFLKKETFKNIPKNIDAAYYLIHSILL